MDALRENWKGLLFLILLILFILLMVKSPPYQQPFSAYHQECEQEWQTYQSNNVGMPPQYASQQQFVSECENTPPLTAPNLRWRGRSGNVA